MGIEDIITLAKNKGVDVLAITDHDCQAANERARILGERFSVRVIPGAEISALDEETGRVIHLLCYNPSCPDRLEELCKQNLAAAKRSAQLVVMKVAKLFSIPPEIIRRCGQGATNLYKQHIMHALMECGVTDSIYSDLHDRLFSEQSSENILVTPSYAPVKTVLDNIRAADGISVLAHPLLYRDDTLLDRMIATGVDGVEVWHPSADAAQSERLLQKTRGAGLLAVGGSDFHGMYNKTPLQPGDYTTPEVYLNEFLNFKNKRRRQQKKEAELGADSPRR